MAIFNNQDPQRENNVGQFGATDESIGAYKQAAEYAKDAEYWAKISESGIKTIEDLLVVVEELLKTSAMQAQDIEDLKAAFAAQDARLMQLISQTNAAVADANAAIEIIDQKIIEVQKQLDILAAMYLTVNTLPPGSPATGSYNPATGEMILNIPEGEPGKDGSVKDLDTASQGVPEAADWGFYVDKDDNTVHKALMSDIAKTFPSVTSVKVGTGSKEIGDIEVTATKLGLGNVQNVASYSKTESDTKSKNFIKPYLTKASADADAPNRQVGEKVLVWNGTSYDFYDIIAGATGTDPNKLSAAPSKQEKRIVTVNLKEPDSTGNIDITVPTGNPSLYLGEMVMFPYDPAKNVSYPGVLPADGRVVAKTSAGDLGPSLVSGQLPVVSETEWQAGAKQYFSWGKLADGITDADATNYIQIRLPDWTTGEAIRSPSKTGDTTYKGNSLQQIPYITTVNGQGPNDSSGAIVLTPVQLGAAASGANSDITSITGLTTALAINQGGTGATTLLDARTSLEVDRLGQQTNGTFLKSPSETVSMFVYNGGEWGAINSSTAAPIPLALTYGGTGATGDSGARINLKLDRIEQPESQTYIRPSSGSTKRLFCHDNGDWGYFDDSSQLSLPLGVTRGGTGSTSLASARTNLQINRITQAPTYTYMESPAGSKVIIADGGGLELQNNSGNNIGIPVSSGGTGAVTSPQARINLGLGPNDTFTAAQFTNVHPLTPQFSGVYRGIVKEGSGGVGAWKYRPTALQVSHGTGAASMVMSIVPGDDLYCNIDSVSYGNGSGAIQLMCKGATYDLASTGTGTAVSWVSSSDRNLKSNLVEIEGALDKVDSLVGYTYDKQIHKGSEETVHEAGIVAQDVQSVLPEAVTESRDGLLGVNSMGLVALLVNAVKELRAEVKSQQAQIELLKNSK